MTETTSSSDGVTPGTGSPVTGTPASDGVTPQTPTLTLEEALKRIADLEHAHKNAKETADRHAKAVAKYEQAQKEAELAKLGDLEKAQARAEQAEKQIQNYRDELVKARVRENALQKGIIDPEIAALALNGKLEYDEDGMPSNLDKALDELIKSKPYLVPKSGEPAPANAAQTASVPNVPAMHPGRSSIQQPGQGTPGRIPSWNEVYKRP